MHYQSAWFSIQFCLIKNAISIYDVQKYCVNLEIFYGYQWKNK